MAWGISHSNNLQDIHFDQTRKIHTLASILGFKKSRYLWSSIYGFAYLTILAGVLEGLLPKLLEVSLLLGAPWIIFSNLRIYRASGPVSALLGSIRGNAARLHFLLGLFICIGLFVSLLSN
jgi:1,4-dihydroxy-2-naphthoate octaprenyltransferase